MSRQVDRPIRAYRKSNLEGKVTGTVKSHIQSSIPVKAVPPQASGGEIWKVVKSLIVLLVQVLLRPKRSVGYCSPMAFNIVCETETKTESMPQSTDKRSLQTTSWSRI